VTAQGIAGHSARPDEGRNAIHMLMPALEAALQLSGALASGPQHDAFDPPVSTLQIGTVQGGTAVNVIPDRASAQIELRALPGADPAGLLAPVIRAAQDAGAETEIIAQYPGLDVAEGADLATLIAKLAGQAPQGAVSFGTEAGLFAQAGYPAIVCGPGDIARAHRPEEFITLEELAEARAFLARLVQLAAR
jgi:acetylornithine deacetylase